MNQTDLRNNVILLFVLFYGVYFGFFIGLPIVLNISYVLASGWLVILGLAGLVAAIKTLLVLFYEVKNITLWTVSKIRDIIRPSVWHVQSAR